MNDLHRLIIECEFEVESDNYKIVINTDTGLYNLYLNNEKYFVDDFHHLLYVEFGGFAWILATNAENQIFKAMRIGYDFWLRPCKVIETEKGDTLEFTDYELMEIANILESMGIT